tara:strand:+ start:1693 stop:2298 length:606 start_codon:yes stop_codon:yes gene_type:complete
VCKQECYKYKTFSPAFKERWLDLGANVGAFSVWAGMQGATIVAAVEPHPENIEMLKTNIKRHGVQASTLHGVVQWSDKPIEDLFIAREGNNYRHTTKPTRGRDSMTVPSYSFESLMKLDPHGIKLDIEGSEIPILNNCESWRNVKKITMEYHFDHDRSIPEFLRRMERLREHGFTVQHKRMPNQESYDYFPAACIVYAWKS